MPQPIAHIVERHVEDAAFLWLQRDDAVSVEPHYNLADLVTLENRLEANLDGVSVAKEFGLEVAMSQAERYMAPGEVFVAGWGAVQLLDGRQFDRVVQIASQERECWRALASAMAWHTSDAIEPFLSVMVRANNPKYLALATQVKTMQSQNPESMLETLLSQQEPSLICTALKSIGRLRLAPWKERIRVFQNHDDPEVQFWACWSGVLVGDSSALNALKHHVFLGESFAHQALALLACVLSPSEFNGMIRTLFSNQESRLLAIAGAGFSGDPMWISGLIKYMDDPVLGRRAGEAFSLITGADLAYLDLDKDWPEGVITGPTEQASDANVALDPDESLPWPDQGNISQWWGSEQGGFSTGKSYIGGGEVSVKQCLDVLNQGYQRQRRMAALRLALMGQPLFPVESPARLQVSKLQIATQNP